MQIIQISLLVPLICSIQAQFVYEQDFDDEIVAIIRRSYEAGYTKASLKRAAAPAGLRKRAAKVVGVRDKCALCMMRGLKYTADTIPAHLSPSEYSALDTIGVVCTGRGDCAYKHDEQEYGEATMWQKAQGHDRGTGSRAGSPDGRSSGGRSPVGRGSGRNSH